METKGLCSPQSRPLRRGCCQLDQALTIDPGDATTWQRKAYALSCLGEHEGAIACCDTALMLDPGYILAWQNRRWLFRTICRHGGAVIAANPDRGPAVWRQERIHERIDLEALTSEIQEAEGFIEVPACIREVATEQDYDNVGLARTVLRELVGRAEEIHRP
ncbi:MAG: tetratricopeptide repeat protein [Methanoculleus sp.]